jgi:pyruvate kinase
MVQVIVTVPPHARFLDEVARHPVVAGLRLNTVMPIKGTHEEVLARLAALGKPLFVDLKGRQLRVAQAAVPPFTEVVLTHRIKHLRTPAVAYFSDGREAAEVLEVDGNRLILGDGPRRFVGPGESVNVPDASLEVDGVLTPEDERYVRAAAKLGLHDFMLSFVESPEDIDAVKRLDPEARVVAKIESEKGLAYAREAHGARLMAARGDLYVEVKRPHRIVRALRDIVRADPAAIVASRILPSLARGLEPECQDVSDVALLFALGYRTLMLGDEVCLRRDSVISALNLIEAIAS